MNYFKLLLVLFFLISTSVQADESTLDKAKAETKTLWDKTKATTADVIDKTADKASEFGEKASELGSKASNGARETGTIVWEKTKEVSNATADAARAGAAKIRSLVNGKECQENSATCYKDKE